MADTPNIANLLSAQAHAQLDEDWAGHAPQQAHDALDATLAFAVKRGKELGARNRASDDA